MKTYYILKPKKLNLEYLVNKYKPNFNFDFDRAYLIVHLVMLLGHEKDNLSKVGLDSRFLERLIGRNYHQYIDFLLENNSGTGNILNGYRYEVGKNPFEYRLTDYYFNGGFELYTITDYKLINKYKQKFVNTSNNEAIRLNYYFLTKYFNNGKLAVSSPSDAIEEANSLVKKKRLRNAKNIVNIMNGEHTITLKTKTDGRVHSNITRLSKKSRKYLQYQGEFLAEVDISSAVPFFLYITMGYYLNKILSKLTDYQYSNSIIYIFDKITGDLDKTELQEFGHAVKSGKLYEQFSNLILDQSFYESEGKDYNKVLKYYQYKFNKQFNHYFDGDLKELKKFAKKGLLSMLFAKSSSYKFEQLVFKELYPTIHKFINEFKDAQSEELNWNLDNRHKKLSYLCFQFEAKVMIDKIAREYDKLHKGKIPVFTLHDCILTTSSNVVELKEFMKSQFKELLGESPNLTIEYSELDTKNKIAS
ncbi:hypothetical protein [Flavobacterium sp. CAN_S2]|uniref:hypothetical protein n=1 Tax=Flavobacterium sp. CAN_S2 TaxID=2787726 RepID=UPI0018C97AC4